MRAHLFTFFFFFLLTSSLVVRSQNAGPVDMRLMDSLSFLKQVDFRATGNQKPLLYNQNVSCFRSAASLQAATFNNKTSSICYDTSGRILLTNDTVVYYTRDPYPTADGNYLLSGEYVINLAPYNKQGGFLLKYDIDGNIIWHKTYDSLNHSGYHYINYYRVMELTDGSIFLAGSTNNQITGNDDLVLTRLDNTGNLTWSKVYKSRLWEMVMEVQIIITYSK